MKKLFTYLGLEHLKREIENAVHIDAVFAPPPTLSLETFIWDV